MTYRGTNTYVIGSGRVALIDPGPEDDRHLAAIFAALDPGETISQIFVTHSHRDHSALARRLSEQADTPVLAFGDSRAGRQELGVELAGIAGGEGVDTGFRPDQSLADGQEIAGPDWQLRAIWTPGHMGNHMCFAAGDAVLTGDHVMGWSTSVISPPDGDLGDFLASLHTLRGHGAKRLLPGHGDPIDRPGARIDELIAHRQARTRQITGLLADASRSAADILPLIYHDLPASNRPAALRTILAHLIDLHKKSLAIAESPISPDAVFRLT